MARIDDKLRRRLDELQASGSDPLRIEVMRCAQRFKRSWIEMAAALTRVRERGAFEAWGYSDLHSYCSEELFIKPATVDKLVFSLVTIKRHAPRLVEVGADHRPVPSVDAVDYFARAAGEHPRAKPAPPRPPEVLEQLREAVFEQARPLSTIRRDFGAALYPKSPEQEALERLRKARATAERLVELLEHVDELSRKRRADVEGVLAALRHDVDKLIAAAEPRAARARIRAV